MVKRRVLLIGAILAATFAFGLPTADACWGWGYGAYGCGWGSCYAPCYSSCYSTSYCDPCCGSWYLGVRPGPIRRCLFGPYRWYYTPDCCGISCCSPCITTSCSPCVSTVSGCCDTVVDCCGAVDGCGCATPTPAIPAAPTKAVAPAPTPAPGSVEQPTSFLEPTAEDSGLLTVHVPYGAKVFINGKETTTKGSTRRYVSYGLQPGLVYKYDIHAELERDGKIYEQTKTVYLKAGSREAVAFGYNVSPVDSVAAVQ